MKKANIKVLSNQELAKDTFKMRLSYNLDAKPGQFINIKLSQHYLRRPISIAKIEKDYFEIIYKIKGEGTLDLSQVQVNTTLDILLPLGNGFELQTNKKVLLIGGGIGIPPLLQLATQLKKDNQVTFLMGFNSEEEYLYPDVDAIRCCLDTQKYFQGNILQYLEQHQLDYDYVYACGPMGMLQALQANLTCDGQISIEERMGCGFGACMGCTCKTNQNEIKRICKEGPVFKLGEVNFDGYAN